MKKLILVALACAALSACGTTSKDRVLSGAGIGAGAGIVLGPVGVAAGAAIGAITGGVTDEEDVNLGKPVWK